MQGEKMKSHKIVLLSIILTLIISLTVTNSFSQEETKPVTPVKPAGPIDPGAVMSSKHPPFPYTITCAECHEIKFDALSTATKQYMKNYRLLDKETVWKYIVELLPGRERFVMATIYQNLPTATTIDFVLNPEEKAFYAVCEKGTEKIEQIKLNPAISAAHYEGWTVAEKGKQIWKSVQVKGRVEIIEAQDPRFIQALQKYQLVRTKPEQAQKRFYILKIAIDRIIYFNSDFLKEGISPYQRWEK